MRVSQAEYQLLHPIPQLHHVLDVLGVSGRVRPRQQRMEDDDRLIQVPNEHALQGRGNVQAGEVQGLGAMVKLGVEELLRRPRHRPPEER